MKKNHCNICTASLLLMPLSAGMGLLTSCSNNDDPVPIDISTENTYTITVDATLQATDGNQTRALGFDGSALKSTWAATDKVSVYRNKQNAALGTLTPTTSDNNSTTLSGTVSFPSAPSTNTKLDLALISKDASYEGQDGTLASISNKYDYALSTVTISSVNNSAKTITISEGTNFVHQQAIVKFTLKDQDGTPVNASKLIISEYDNKLVSSVSGSTVYYGAITVTPVSPTNEIYVALRGVSSSIITLTAFAGSDIYTYYAHGVTFGNGSYYTVTVKMEKVGTQVLNGIEWANDNLPGYYQWGKTDNSWTNSWRPDDFADPATAIWGAPWRTPTKEEFQALIDNTTAEVYDEDNKVKGFTGIGCRGTGSNSGFYIFLPAWGYRYGENLYSNHVIGSIISCDYWTSTPLIYQNQHTNQAWKFACSTSSNASMSQDVFKHIGCSIRPVRDITHTINP